jgi:cold shock CspA family protein
MSAQLLKGAESPCRAEAGDRCRSVDDSRAAAIGTPRRAQAEPAWQGDGILATGTANWLDAHVGCGLIPTESGGRGVLVHILAVERPGLGKWRKGQQVAYEAHVVPRRSRASAEDFKAL